jgi:hypothetical protein
MVATKQNAVRNVGATVISLPLLYVVSFAPGGRSFAITEAAAAISSGEGYTLLFGEHPLFATDVEWLEVVVESDFCGATSTGEALDGVDAHCLRLAFDVAGTTAGTKR